MDPWRDGSELAPDETLTEGVLFRLAVCGFNVLGVFLLCALEQRVGAERTVSVAAPILAICTLSGDLLNDSTQLGRFCCLPVAASLGATHFLSGPAFKSSKLKAVTMAATTHMHKTAATTFKWIFGLEVTAEQARATLQSAVIALGILVGALVGALALHKNPFPRSARRPDGKFIPAGQAEQTLHTSYLFVPAALVQFAALLAHDCACFADHAEAPALQVAPPKSSFPEAADDLKTPLVVTK